MKFEKGKVTVTCKGCNDQVVCTKWGDLTASGFKKLRRAGRFYYYCKPCEDKYAEYQQKQAEYAKRYWAEQRFFANMGDTSVEEAEPVVNSLDALMAIDI